MSLPERYYRGDTVALRRVTTNESDVATDPDTEAVKIYDPDGTLDNTESWASEETGSSVMYYDIASDAAVGDWTIESTITSGSYTKTDYIHFTVELKPYETE